MTVSEKLQETSFYAQQGKIVLFHEGMFWKAYQEAAFMFVSNIRPYQVNCNYVKKVGTDVFSLGFPVPSSLKILSEYSYTEDSLRIIITLDDYAFSDEDYLAWRHSTLVQPVVRHRPPGDTLLSFKNAYELQKQFYLINRNVDREYKFTLSEKIKEELHEVLMNVYFANDQDILTEKRIMIQSALHFSESVKLRVRLLHDLKQISTKQYANLSVQIADLLSDLKKWYEKTE